MCTLRKHVPLCLPSPPSLVSHTFLRQIFRKQFNEELTAMMNSGEEHLESDIRCHFLVCWGTRVFAPIAAHASSPFPTQPRPCPVRRYILKNVQGIGNTLFPPMRAFEILVQRSIVRLERPCRNCAQLVHDELSRIILDLPCEPLQRYTKLREKVVGVTAEMLRGCLRFAHLALLLCTSHC
jgi:hypothetical protein